MTRHPKFEVKFEAWQWIESSNTTCRVGSVSMRPDGWISIQLMESVVSAGSSTAACDDLRAPLPIVPALRPPPLPRRQLGSSGGSTSPLWMGCGLWQILVSFLTQTGQPNGDLHHLAGSIDTLNNRDQNSSTKLNIPLIRNTEYHIQPAEPKKKYS